MIPRQMLALAGVAALGAGLYARRRSLWARLLNLPPVRYGAVATRTQRVSMPDGVRLATDLFLPRASEPLPTILIRTPYGRPGTALGLPNRFVAQRFAERGYNVVFQDVRGRFDSEGVWEPYVHEAADGAATLAWIARQPWSDGQVGMWGQSYVGYAQWAAASTGSTHLKALVPVITQSFLAERGAHGYQLDRTLRWLLLLDAMSDPALPLWETLARTTSARVQDRLLASAFQHLPLATVDEAILGRHVPFFRRWMAHPDPAAPYWQAVDFRPQVASVEAPVHLVAGWYDIFLEGQLADYEALRGAGRAPYLTIGPWTHLDVEGQWESIRLALRWFDAYLRGDPSRLRASPVRLYVMGAEEWRDYGAWPPQTECTRFFLREHGGLADSAPSPDAPPDRYRYDPADPTPNLGGALLSTAAGHVDNRPLEQRADVLLYSTPPLPQAVEIVGTVRVVLWVRSSLAHTDFFGRLTDVHPDGRSINLCDGHVRLPLAGAAPAAGELQRVEIELSPTAYRFRPGHRIRLLVSSGAHPRINRNLGTGEPLFDGTTMQAAEQTVYHDAARPSHLLLPTV